LSRVENVAPEHECDEMCPKCGDIWWKAVVRLLKDTQPTITGWRPDIECASCGYIAAFAANNEQP
jgi:hypothetical protein